MSITIYITEDISRMSEIRLVDGVDDDFMRQHESLLVLACAGDKQAQQQLYDLAIENGYQEEYIDTSGADVSSIEVVEE